MILERASALGTASVTGAFLIVPGSGMLLDQDPVRDEPFKPEIGHNLYGSLILFQAGQRLAVADIETGPWLTGLLNVQGAVVFIGIECGMILVMEYHFDADTVANFRAAFLPRT